MTGERVLTADHAWNGGHYELLIDVGGGKPAPGRVAAAAAALWSHPDLDGPYPKRDLEPREQTRMEPGTDQGYGVATLPGGARVPCGTWPMSSIPDFLPDGLPYPPDLLIFYVPLALLGERAWPEIGGFPFQADQDTRPWQEPLENWFAGIAVHVFDRERFKLAVIDFELDPDYDVWRSWADGKAPIPSERRVDFLMAWGKGLRRFPRTVWC